MYLPVCPSKCKYINRKSYIRSYVRSLHVKDLGLNTSKKRTKSLSKNLQVMAMVNMPPRSGGSLSLPAETKYTPPQDQVHPLGPGREPPPPHPTPTKQQTDSGIWSTIGRYTSYWNTFFLFCVLRF